MKNIDVLKYDIEKALIGSVPVINVEGTVVEVRIRMNQLLKIEEQSNKLDTINLIDLSITELKDLKMHVESCGKEIERKINTLIYNNKSNDATDIDYGKLLDAFNTLCDGIEETLVKLESTDDEEEKEDIFNEFVGSTEHTSWDDRPETKNGLVRNYLLGIRDRRRSLKHKYEQLISKELGQRIKLEKTKSKKH